MNCPRCGYSCPDLDTYCLRCRMMAAEGRPRRFTIPSEQTVVMSDLRGFLPEPSPRRSAAWLTALLLVLALLIGGLVWCFNPPAHTPASVPLTTNAARPTIG